MLVPIYRSARIPQVPNRYGYYVDVEEYELGDLDEPSNYKTALADLESDKWLKAMNMEMKIDFTQNPNEPCVYLKASGSNVAFLVLYVDDILLMGNSVTMLQEVKSWLCKCFSIKDLGEAAYILGIKIIRDRSKRLISLSQSAYLEKILKKFRMENSNKRTKPKDKLKVSCYDDASFHTDRDDTKSQTGYVFVLNGEAMDWKSAKKSTTAMYSTEAEYITAAEVSMEAVRMSKFIDGLRDVKPSNKRPMKMLYDNEPALAIASYLEIIKRARHFQRKYHYIRKVIQEGEIVLKKVHTYDNVADLFTN
nr:hypothetical protein [Tanacetum cinerariifolium]